MRKSHDEFSGDAVEAHQGDTHSCHSPNRRIRDTDLNLLLLSAVPFSKQLQNGEDPPRRKKTFFEKQAGVSTA